MLKLAFNEEFEEDEEKCKATYDPGDHDGTITARIPKLVKGLHFTDLDVISHLLRRRMEADQHGGEGPPLIEAVGDSSFTAQTDDPTQETEISGEAPLLMRGNHYGFDNRYYDIFRKSGDHFSGLFELPDPEGTTHAERRSQRMQREVALFDSERYLGDLFGAELDEYYLAAMDYSAPWGSLWDAWREQATAAAMETATQSLEAAHLTGDGTGEKLDSKPVELLTPDALFQRDGYEGFSENDNEEMLEHLSKKPFLVPLYRSDDDKQSVEIHKSLLLCLADILFAYCYDARITGGDPSVESAFNITRLSCTLSWLEDYRYDGSGVRDAVINSARRSMIYPYCRNWKLCRKVLADVTKVFLCGRRTVLQCLLRIHRIMRRTSTHYILNKLYILDFCLWVQALDSSIFEKFGQDYNSVKSTIGKNEIDLNIPAIEAAALNAAAPNDTDSSSDDSSNSVSSTTSSDEDADNTNDAVDDHLVAPLDVSAFASLLDRLDDTTQYVDIDAQLTLVPTEMEETAAPSCETKKRVVLRSSELLALESKL